MPPAGVAATASRSAASSRVNGPCTGTAPPANAAPSLAVAVPASSTTAVTGSSAAASTPKSSSLSLPPAIRVTGAGTDPRAAAVACGMVAAESFSKRMPRHCATISRRCSRPPNPASERAMRGA